jgi:hypothetical protein
MVERLEPRLSSTSEVAGDVAVLRATQYEQLCPGLRRWNVCMANDFKLKCTCDPFNSKSPLTDHHESNWSIKLSSPRSISKAATSPTTTSTCPPKRGPAPPPPLGRRTGPLVLRPPCPLMAQPRAPSAPRRTSSSPCAQPPPVRSPPLSSSHNPPQESSSPVRRVQNPDPPPSTPAAPIDAERQGVLRAVFEICDADGDGLVTKGQMREALMRAS